MDAYKPYSTKSVKNLDILLKLSPMRHSTRRSNSRDRCTFHNDVGYKTKDCFTLNDAIEEAARNSELFEFVDQGVSQ
ncbi:hypothetical protein J1N35_025122 [Gossypium stocksii]|uniref:Uncharacterized protein n=1 Tax=Gossypium stocksii TaxID=47602 RepID=A0A9D3V5Y2_9ROSI|nr:hypothetical protein J1N35_025122 [Gossypium stocksii]